MKASVRDMVMQVRGPRREERGVGSGWPRALEYASDGGMYKIEGPEDGGKAPNGPNFPLIVVLFLVTILVCFGLALVFVPEFGHFIHALRPKSLTM